MSPRLFHIYGPLWVHSFGLMIVLGLFLFIYLTYSHPVRKRYMSPDDYANMLVWGAISLFFGGRLFKAVTEWHTFRDNPIEILYPWVGGLGILGAIVACAITLVVFFKKRAIPVLPMLDLVTLYTPLFQAVSRIGCFFAGCCFGLAAPTLFCAVTYTDPQSLAPLNTPLHPTQIYACLASITVFLILRYGVYGRSWPGTTLWTYLMLESIARFVVDFWRWDTVHTAMYFSKAQWTALGLFVAALLGWLFTRYAQKKADDNVTV